jgi:hypothetical protein
MLTQLEIPYSHDKIFSAFGEVFTEIKEAANIDLSIPEDSKEVWRNFNKQLRKFEKCS